MANNSKKSKSKSKDGQLTVNVRLLVISIVLVVTLGVGSFFWHKYQQKKLSTALRARATSLEEDEEYIKAANYLYRYLQYQPDDNEARIRLAQVFGKRATSVRVNRAINLYYQAVGVADEEKKIELRQELIPILLAVGRGLEANKEAQTLWDSVKDSDAGLGEDDPKKPVAEANIAESQKFRALARFMIFQISGDLNDPEGKDSRSLIKALEDARVANPYALDLTVKTAALLRSEDLKLFDQKQLEAEFGVKSANSSWRKNYANTIVDDMVVKNLSHFNSELAIGKEDLSKASADLKEAEKGESASEIAAAQSERASILFRLSETHQKIAEAYLQKFVYLVQTDADNFEQISININESLKYIDDGLAYKAEKDEALSEYERATKLLEDTESDEETKRKSNADLYNDDIEEAGEQIKIAAAQYDLDMASFGRVDDPKDHALISVIPRFKAVLAINNKNLRAYEGMSAAYKLGDDVESFITECENGLKIVGENDVVLNGLLCDAILTRGKTEDLGRAKSIVERLRASVLAFAGNATNSQSQAAVYFRQLRLLDARVSMLEGDYENAIQLIKLAELELASEGRAKAATLALLGKAYSESQKWDLAAAAYEQAAIANPNLGEAQQLAALAWADSGQHKKALDYYRPLARNTTNALIKVTYAQLLFKQLLVLPPGQRNWQEFSAALVAADRASKINELKEPWRLELLKVQSEISMKGWNKDKVDSNKAEFDQLKKRLVQLETDHGSIKQVIRGLIFVYEEFGLADEADRVLQKHQQLDVTPVEKLLAETDLLARRNQLEKAKNLLRAEIDNLPKVNRSRIVYRLIELANQMSADAGESESSFAQMKQALDGIEITDVATLRRLADQAINQGELDEAKKLEDQLIEIEGQSGSIWRYCRIRRLLGEVDENDKVNEANLVEAENINRELQQLRPSWPFSSLLLGLIKDQHARQDNDNRDKLEDALTAYKSAKSLGVNSVFVNERIINILQRLGEINEVDRLLKDLGESITDSVSLTASEIQNAYDLKRFKQAEELAEANVKNRPKDHFARIWYGHISRLNRKNDQALKAFKEAVELGPKEKETWGALFSHYVMTRDVKKAGETLEEMVKELELEESEQAYLLAQGYQRLDRGRDAAENYDRAVELDPTNVAYHITRAKFFSGIDIAMEETSLREIIKLTTDKAKSSTAKVRLAEVLYMQGKTDEWRKLLDTADANSLELRWTAVLLSRSKSPSARKKSIEIFEKAVNENPGSVGRQDRFNLAKLYVINSKELELTDEEQKQLDADSQKQPEDQRAAWLADEQKKRLDEKRQPWLAKAEEQLINIVAISDPDFEHVKYYVEYLIDHDKYSQAERWLKKVDLMSVNGLRALRLKGKLLQSQGRFNEWAPILEATAKQRQKEITENEFYVKEEKNKLLYDWAAEVGLLYSVFDLHKEGEKWIRIGAQRPNGFELLAYNLAFQERVDEAIDVCLAEKEKNDSTRPGIVIASLLTQHKVSAETLKKAQGLIDIVVNEHKQDTSLLMAVGDMHAVNKDVAEAIRYYENVLKENDKHVLALNNLATLYSEIPDKRDLALKYIERAIRVSGKRPNWLDTEGMIYLYKGETKEAITRLRQAASVRGDPRFVFHLAVAYHENGEADKAKDNFKVALDRDLESQVLTGRDLEYLEEMKSKYGF